MWIGKAKVMKRAFFVISIIFVAMMYIVPYTALSGREGIETFAFWALTATAYFIIASLFLRRL